MFVVFVWIICLLIVDFQVQFVVFVIEIVWYFVGVVLMLKVFIFSCSKCVIFRILKLTIFRYHNFCVSVNFQCFNFHRLIIDWVWVNFHKKIAMFCGYELLTVVDDNFKAVLVVLCEFVWVHLNYTKKVITASAKGMKCPL